MLFLLVVVAFVVALLVLLRELELELFTLFPLFPLFYVFNLLFRLGLRVLGACVIWKGKKGRWDQRSLCC